MSRFRSLYALPLLALCLIVSACRHGAASSAAPVVADSDSLVRQPEIDAQEVVRQFYSEVILGNAPANRAMHAVCTSALQDRLNEAARQEARRLGDTDDCTDCLSATPFVATSLDALPSTADDCHLIAISPDSAGWYRVDFSYYGAQTWARVHTVEVDGRILLDSVLTER